MNKSSIYNYQYTWQTPSHSNTISAACKSIDICPLCPVFSYLIYEPIKQN